MQNNFRPYIIAEIGINHNGNLQNAINLIKSAKRAGANAVKFQVFKASTLAREKMRKTSQQKKLVNKRISLLGMWKKMELSFNDLKKLKNISNQNKIDFICSVFDKESLFAFAWVFVKSKHKLSKSKTGMFLLPQEISLVVLNRPLLSLQLYLAKLALLKSLHQNLWTESYLRCL